MKKFCPVARCWARCAAAVAVWMSLSVASIAVPAQAQESEPARGPLTVPEHLTSALVEQLLKAHGDQVAGADAALVEIGEPAVPGLMAKVENGQGDEKFSAIMLLLKIGGPAAKEVVPHAIGWLTDFGVRRAGIGGIVARVDGRAR